MIFSTKCVFLTIPCDEGRVGLFNICLMDPRIFWYFYFFIILFTINVLEYHSLFIISYCEIPTISTHLWKKTPYYITLYRINPGLWFDYPPAKESNTYFFPVCGWITSYAVLLGSIEDLYICLSCFLIFFLGFLHNFFWVGDYLTTDSCSCCQSHEVILVGQFLCCDC